eukprot:71496-Amphidinium_carterae.1
MTSQLQHALLTSTAGAIPWTASLPSLCSRTAPYITVQVVYSIHRIATLTNHAGVSQTPPDGAVGE